VYRIRAPNGPEGQTGLRNEQRDKWAANSKRGAWMKSDNEPGLSRAAMTRRVLLAAGGLVLLGELVAGEGSGATSHQPRSGGAPRTRVMRDEAGLPHASPNARPVATRQQAEPDRTAAGQPAKSAHADASGGQPSYDAVPRERRPPPANGQPITTIDDGPKVVALTIDDGPSPTYTPQILQLLDSYGITATFSMVGRNVAAYPSLAREVSEAGHVIVNHTWSHANLPLLAPVAQADQMTRATAVIQQATGQKPAMFRAPYGAWSPDVLAQCRQLRLTPLDWSVDPRDWSRPGVSAIVANIMRNTRTGSIILEHDGGGNRSQTVAALTYVLPRLLAEGFRFGTP
jgi:peptidoglycan/xylan/chitin deacetylase (PgdA/CDA1 family)